MIWNLAALFAKSLAFLLERAYPWGTDALAKFLGILAFDVLRLRRKIILMNLRIAMPELSQKERLRIGRESMISIVRVFLEFIASDRAFAKAQITVEGSEHFHTAIKAGGGLYALVLHLGNWELMVHKTTKDFVRPHIIVKEIGKGALAQWVNDKRVRSGMVKITRDGPVRATEQILDHIEKGQLIAFVADQRRSRGQVLPFFGRNSHSNDSVMRLWVKKQAPIIPTSLVRTGPGQYLYRIWEPFLVEEKESEEETIRHNTLRLNLVFEKVIREAPEQYFWHHRRWKGFEND